MRVSTHWIYANGIAALSANQAALLRTQQQLASGQRVLIPSEDPIAAANALTTEQARAMSEQFIRNQGTALGALQLAESTLAHVGELLQEARELAVAAGNGALGPADRAALAIELRGKVDTLLGLANVRDAAGGYVFSGYQDGVLPFSRGAGGVAYFGDQGSRALQVGARRLLEIGASGADVFEGARAGNGSFTVAPGPANTGGGVADAGQVTDPSALTLHQYRIVFGAGGASYDIVDVTTATTLVSGAAFAPGTAIWFDGMQVGINGAPNAGDRFDVTPSGRQSVFALLEGLAGVLESAAAGSVNAAQLHTRLAVATAGIDEAHDHVLGVRTAFGARMRELDLLGVHSADAVLLHRQELSRLLDLDYAEAASRLAMQQMSLEAAQQSYLRVTGLSLFNFL